MNGASASSLKTISTWDIAMYKVAKALQDMPSITIDNVTSLSQRFGKNWFGPDVHSCQYSVSLKHMPSSAHNKPSSLLAFDLMRSSMNEVRDELVPLAPSCCIEVVINDDKNPSQYQTPRSHEFLMPTALVKLSVRQSDVKTYNINPIVSSGGKQKQPDVSEMIEDIVAESASSNTTTATATIISGSATDALRSLPALFGWRMLLKLIVLFLLLLFCIFQLENLLIVYNYVHTHEGEVEGHGQDL